MASDGLNEDGKMVGRRGVIDTNVLKVLARYESARPGQECYLFEDALKVDFCIVCEAIEDAEKALRPREQRRHNMMNK
jgi:hypothetical protein